MSISYEIYKKAVGGKTMSGENMKAFDEMPEQQKNGWISVDNHFNKKVEITESPTYELYKSKNKDAKEFNELPESIKKIWASLDKNYEKIVKVPVPKEPKAKKEPKEKSIVEKEKNLEQLKKKESSEKVEKTSIAEKMEALKKLKGK